MRAFNVNVGGAFNVMAAARDAGVRRLIFASSREVYGDSGGLPVSERSPLHPANVYGFSKAAAEHALQMACGSVELAIVRLANVYGPGDWGRVIPTFLSRAIRDEPLPIYGGDQIVDFIWVSTVVGIIRQVAFAAPFHGVVNVGSGQGTRIIDLAERIVHLTQSRSAIEIEPPRTFEVRRFVAQTSRARELFGYTPASDPLHGLASWRNDLCAAGRSARQCRRPVLEFYSTGDALWSRRFRPRWTSLELNVFSYTAVERRAVRSSE